jgi:hypothetical protein
VRQPAGENYVRWSLPLEHSTVYYAIWNVKGSAVLKCRVFSAIELIDYFFRFSSCRFQSSSRTAHLYLECLTWTVVQRQSGGLLAPFKAASLSRRRTSPLTFLLLVQAKCPCSLYSSDSLSDSFESWTAAFLNPRQYSHPPASRVLKLSGSSPPARVALQIRIAMRMTTREPSGRRLFTSTRRQLSKNPVSRS